MTESKWPDGWDNARLGAIFIHPSWLFSFYTLMDFIVVEQ